MRKKEFQSKIDTAYFTKDSKQIQLPMETETNLSLPTHSVLHFSLLANLEQDLTVRI